jgi:GxxExxY protein
MMNEGSLELQHAELTERIIGVFYKVSRELGFGFLESIYRRSLLIALREAGLKAEQEVQIKVFYHGQEVRTFYADIVVEGLIILELKAADAVTKLFEAQLLHYLRSCDIEIDLVLAFGGQPKFSRVYLPNSRKANLRH